MGLAASDDRQIVLRKKEGVPTRDNTGLVDKRLFSGEDNLRILRDPLSNLWTFKYNSGILPQPLKQKFTSFNKAMKFAHGYFDRRGLDIIEVIDNGPSN